MYTIPISLLLEMILSGIILFSILYLIKKISIDTLQEQFRKEKRYRLWFKVSCSAWLLYFFYYTYHLLEKHPFFTVLMLALLCLGFWSQWKNLFAGIILHLDRKFIQGKSIHVKNHEGRIIKTGLLNTWLETSAGLEVKLPNDLINSNGYSLLKSNKKNDPIIIKLEKSKLIKLGGEEEIKRISASSPWSDPDLPVEIHYDDEGFVTLKAWSLTATDRTAFLEYLRSKVT